MPWKEWKIMDQREQFREWGLSEGGVMCSVWDQPPDGRQMAGASSRGSRGWRISRRPHTQPHHTPAALVARIVAMKHRHPSFGPKKIRDRLRAEAPGEAWPVDSTMGVILSRAGLVRPRRVRRRVPADPHGLSQGTAAAPLWSADFKGDFVVGTGQRCYPLTVMDQASRYLLRCQGVLTPPGAPCFTLPATIRTDNGPPFASTALGGSRLGWVLGIRPERIRPGTPSENGGHERMHRTLKAAMGAPAASFAAQQRRLAAFVEEYNWARSHEAPARPVVCISRPPGRIRRSCRRSWGGDGWYGRCGTMPRFAVLSWRRSPRPRRSGVFIWGRWRSSSRSFNQTPRRRCKPCVRFIL